jgi:hypothetical protein
MPFRVCARATIFFMCGLLDFAAFAIFEAGIFSPSGT